MTKAPVLDGIVDPAEWREATHVERFVDPFTGAPVKDQTEGWVGFDAQAIYVAFICHDEQPGGIVGREVRPGAEFQGEDTVRFRINPFGTRSHDGQSEFLVNVLNTQNEQVAGGRSAKREWRGDWKSATRRFEGGWSVEMRIPWAMLNYPSGKVRSMDINLERYQARTRIGSQWANTSVNDRPELAGIWEGVEPPARDFRKRLQFLGYTAPEYDDGRFSLRSGLDVRYALTQTMTSLVSLNPDFRNIEQQIAGVDFTRTERFFDEVRPFFTEGSGFFNLTPDFTFGTMFYPTGRIPTFDYGVKAYGKVTPNLSFGALTTVDTGNATSSVARIGKSFGPKASISGYVERYDRQGLTNNTFGLNGGAQRGNYGADFQIASEGEDREKADVAGAVSVSYEVPKWFSVTRAEWVPEKFAPPLAFIPWTDRVGWYNFTEYNTEYRTGPLRDFGWDMFTTDFRTYGGKLQQQGSDVSTGFTTRKDIHVSANHSQTRYADGLDSVTGLGLTFNQSNRFKRYGVYFETGDRSSKPSTFASFDCSLRLFKKIDVGFAYSALRFDGTDTLAIGTLGWEISPTRAITGRFVQRNGKQNAYLAFRNGGLNGTEIYVVVGDPNAETFQKRVSVKLVWAF